MIFNLPILMDIPQNNGKTINTEKEHLLTGQTARMQYCNTQYTQIEETKDIKLVSNTVHIFLKHISADFHTSKILMPIY